MAEKRKSRRDFIFVATGTVLAGGIVLAGRPFLKQMSPAADAVAEAGLDIDVSLIEEGQELRVLVKGRPVLIRHRTSTEIRAAQADDGLSTITGTSRDQERLKSKPNGRYDPRYLIIHPICPHMGAILISEAGDFDGFYCPAHGAHFDSSGRARKGPVAENMAIPPYDWVTDTVLRLQFLPMD